MDEVIDPDESITRFLRNKNHMRPALGRPHFSAFLPRLPDGDISVYRTAGLGVSEISDIGVQYVASAEAPLNGSCDLLAAAFFDQALRIESVPIPHERHANVTGWTVDARNRIVARKLADKATLTVY